MLSRTQARPGRTVKQEREEISPNHVQRLNIISEASPIKCAGRESAGLPALSHTWHTKFWYALYEEVPVTGRFSIRTFYRRGLTLLVMKKSRAILKDFKCSLLCFSAQDYYSRPERGVPEQGLHPQPHLRHLPRPRKATVHHLDAQQQSERGSNIYTTFTTSFVRKFTVQVCRMIHRKWRETRQQVSRSKSGHHLSCCLIPLHFLWGILRTSTVD